MEDFDNFFPSYYTAADALAEPQLRSRNYDGAGATIQELIFNLWQASNDISRHMERLALAITKVIQSSSSKNMITGADYNREISTSVRWSYLPCYAYRLCSLLPAL